MKKALLLLTLVVSITTFSQIKVIGYLPSYRWETLEKLDYDHLSHVIAAFTNPDSTGSLSFEHDLKKFSKICHKNNTEAIVSMCGGGNYSWGEQYSVYEKLIETPESRTMFVNNIVNFVLENNLDGLDNDMEGKALVLKNYNIFAQELADSLHSKGLEYSAALYVGGQWGVDNLDKTTLLKHDYLMTMSYGGVGSWNWKDKPDDSNYPKYVADVNHVLNLGLDTSKTIGGMPFYYTEFPLTQQTDYNKYNGLMCDLYANYPTLDRVKSDTITSSNGNPIYLNSLETYYKKIDLAVTNNSGIMIWELGQDCFDDKSIMNAIATYLDNKNVSVEKSSTK